WTKTFLTLFVLSFMILGLLGTQHLTPTNVWICRACTFIYYAYFILMPFYTKYERCKPEPDRVRYK
nr:cytochrome b [Gammaproteobacteria bacterium]